MDWLSTSGGDGAVCIWNLADRSKLLTAPIGVTSLAFDPAGKYLAVGALRQSVMVWDLNDLMRLNLERQAEEDAIQSQNGSVEELEPWFPKPLFDLNGHQDRIGAVAFSPDGSWLVSAGDDCTIRIWNVLTGRLVVARQFDAAVQSLVFSKDGKFLYTGNGNTTCYRLEFQRLLED
jgi:hypothetical protein